MKTIIIQDLEEKLKKKEKDELFIDVRSKEEFEKKHINGFENKDFEDFDTWSSLCKDKIVYLICFTDNRSRTIEEKFKKLFPKTIVFVCEGGILAWKESNRPLIENKSSIPENSKKEGCLSPQKTEKQKKTAWSVIQAELIREKNLFINFSPQRQELILVGGLLLFGLISLSLGRIFILIIGIIYLFSGITGKAILQMLLEKMPWNKK